MSGGVSVQNTPNGLGTDVAVSVVPERWVPAAWRNAQAQPSRTVKDPTAAVDCLV